MTLIAGFFWNPPEGGIYGMGNGFMVGLEMSLRAILIVSTFSALSVEIRNPRITESLLKLGLGNAYAAVSLAFNSLPVMLDRSANLKTFIRNPVRAFSQIIVEAQRWLNRYQLQLEK